MIRSYVEYIAPEGHVTCLIDIPANAKEIGIEKAVRQVAEHDVIRLIRLYSVNHFNAELREYFEYMYFEPEIKAAHEAKGGKQDES